VIKKVTEITRVARSKVMIEVTQKAAEMIKEILKNRKGSGTIRILSQRSC